MHLNTTTCRCGNEFTIQDIKPPLMGSAAAIGNKQKNFYGGNVDKFSVANCAECGLKYTLWLRQMGQTWKVVTISANGWDSETIGEEAAAKVVKTKVAAEPTIETEPDAFDEMDKDALKAWLDERLIKYHPQTGDKKLREACRAALLIVATDEENEL